MKFPKILYLVLRYTLLNCLLSLKLKIKNLKGKLKMPQKQKPKKSPTKESAQSKKSLEKKETEFTKEDKVEEEKPKFQDLLRPEGGKGSPLAESSKESCPPGGEKEAEPREDPDFIEVCADVIALPFAIWHEINPKVQPLSEKEKKNISVPLAKVVDKYGIGSLIMKEEYVLCFYLGSAIYGRTKEKKAKRKNADNSREKKTGENHSRKAAPSGS